MAPSPALPHIVNPLTAFPDDLRGGVVAIGNFDGVHRGHQFVLAEASAVAEERGIAALAMTFEPHPRTLFQPDKPVFRLTPASEKATLLSACGMDAVLETPFDRQFSSMSAEDFITQVLLDGLRARHVVIGFDFHFGARRSGSPDFLKDAGQRHGFGVTVVEAHGDESGSAFSSSAVRECLIAGEIAEANDVLGYRWFVTGEVRHGEKRGRELGFPTANMTLDPACGLRHGIYAVRAAVDGRLVNGVANFGRRPTYDNGAPLLETFLFDFSGDLYGRTISILFEDFQRPEARFDSSQALIEQMQADSRQAAATLASDSAITPLDRHVVDRLVAATAAAPVATTV